MHATNMMLFYQKSLTSKFYLPNHRVVYVKANKLIIEKKLKQKNLIYKYTVAVLLWQNRSSHLKCGLNGTNIKQKIFQNQLRSGR